MLAARKTGVAARRGDKKADMRGIMPQLLTTGILQKARPKARHWSVPAA